MSETPDDRVCENCGRWIEDNEILYRARLEVFAEPVMDDRSLRKSRDESAREWESLLEKLEKMDDQQVQDATDQVYESYEFNLCPSCRQEMHRRIKSHREIL